MSVSNGDAITDSIHTLPHKSVRTGLETKISDVEIPYLEYLEKALRDQVGQLHQRGPGDIMSDSEYVRRRDEINRRLRRDEQEINEIIEERDQALKDKQNVESAISDVQEKYERVLKTVLSLKEKEDLLIERDNENVMKVEQMDKELEEFKETARKQVESEYQNWLSKLAEAEATNTRLKAMMRKAEMKVEKMDHTLGQRSKENEELNNLCDELINNNSSRKNSVQD